MGRLLSSGLMTSVQLTCFCHSLTALAVIGQDPIGAAADADGFGVDLDAMPQGAAAIFQYGGVGDGGADVVFGVVDGVAQVLSACEAGGDDGGVGATGAVDFGTLVGGGVDVADAIKAAEHVDGAVG